MEDTNKTDLDVLTSILAALKTLDIDAQKRTLQAVATFLGISDFGEHKSHQGTQSVEHGISFSENRDMTPKEFLRDKLPKTDVERVACLAYYLTHYKGMPYFKTLDISTLNTEAAQPKFSNTAVSVSNATRAGLLVQASKGNNQISSVGEVFVQALPDREAAKDSLKNMRVRKRNRKIVSKNSNKD